MGTGTAYYLGFIKVYTASLYASKNTTGDDILKSDVSKCLRLTYAVNLEKKNFIEAANTSLQRQFSPEELAVYDAAIQRIHSSYTDVRKGDQYAFCYDHREGETTLSLNDVLEVRITDPGFAALYLSIWLGEHKPLDQTLREALLFQKTTQEPDHG